MKVTIVEGDVAEVLEYLRVRGIGTSDVEAVTPTPRTKWEVDENKLERWAQTILGRSLVFYNKGGERHACTAVKWARSGSRFVQFYCEHEGFGQGREIPMKAQTRVAA